MPGAHFLSRNHESKEDEEVSSPSQVLSTVTSFSSQASLSQFGSAGPTPQLRPMSVAGASKENAALNGKGRTKPSSSSSKKPAPLSSAFPIVDWLAIANHLFLAGSIGYFGMNFLRSVLATYLTNASVSNGIANAFFFSLGLMFICSSLCYWVDVLQFPRHWARRKHYHAGYRELEAAAAAEDDGEELDEDEEEEYFIAASPSSSDWTRAKMTGSLNGGSNYANAIRPRQITVPGGKESSLYEEDAFVHPNHHDDPNAPPSNGWKEKLLTTNRRRDSSSDDEDEDRGTFSHSSSWSFERSQSRRTVFRRLWRSFCPIRTESYAEMLNLIGAVLNTVSTALPYLLTTFKADHGVSFDSVPLAISLMDFFSMFVWLCASFLLFYIWRRDKIMSAYERWEEAEEQRSGMDRFKRRQIERLEKLAEKEAVRAGETPKPSQAKRFDPKKVPNTWIDLVNLQWWAAFTNVGGCIVYWAAAMYGISISVAAAQGKFANSQRHAGGGNGGHGGGGSFDGGNGGNWSLTPQEVQGWVQLQRIFNLTGDCVYLACAVFCELVYYYESIRELPTSIKRPPTKRGRSYMPSSTIVPANFSPSFSGVSSSHLTPSTSFTLGQQAGLGAHLLPPAGYGPPVARQPTQTSAENDNAAVPASTTNGQSIHSTTNTLNQSVLSRHGSMIFPGSLLPDYDVELKGVKNQSRPPIPKNPSFGPGSPFESVFSTRIE